MKSLFFSFLHLECDPNSWSFSSHFGLRQLQNGKYISWNNTVEQGWVSGTMESLNPRWRTSRLLWKVVKRSNVNKIFNTAQ